jgi:ornithine carbamoyltransferase
MIAAGESGPPSDLSAITGEGIKTQPRKRSLRPKQTMKRDFLDLTSLSAAEIRGLLQLAVRLKSELKNGMEHPYLRGRTLAMIFQKPSLRTRLTFETGMAQLGGHAIYLAPDDIGIGERESVKDVARNLSRWVDLIMIRTFSHATCMELAREASVPVINGLTDLLHPCQLMGDLQTLSERYRDLRALRIAFVGDGFNLAQSWIEAATLLHFELRVACPAGYEPGNEFIARLQREPQSLFTRDPVEAVRDADVVYTDTWTSMGQEREAVKRRRDFENFQVNSALLRSAQPGAMVMHCLPAHRGEEITDEVLDGPQSMVLEQAENRLHAQKAIMLWLLRPSVLAPDMTPGAGQN